MQVSLLIFFCSFSLFFTCKFKTLKRHHLNCCCCFTKSLFVVLVTLPQWNPVGLTAVLIRKTGLFFLHNSIRKTHANEYRYLPFSALAFFLSFIFHTCTLTHSTGSSDDGSHADYYLRSSFCQMVHCQVELGKIRNFLHNILTSLLNQFWHGENEVELKDVEPPGLYCTLIHKLFVCACFVGVSPP